MYMLANVFETEVIDNCELSDVGDKNPTKA